MHFCVLSQRWAPLSRERAFACVRRLASELTLKWSTLSLNDATLLFAWGRVTSEERVIEHSLKKKKKSWGLAFQDSILCLPLRGRWRSPAGLCLAGLREAALTISKVEWKHTLSYYCLHVVVALDAQDGPLISGRPRLTV